MFHQDSGTRGCRHRETHRGDVLEYPQFLGNLGGTGVGLYTFPPAPPHISPKGGHRETFPQASPRHRCVGSVRCVHPTLEDMSLWNTVRNKILP